MTEGVRELLTRLDRLNVRLRLEEGRLRFSAPKGVMTDQLRSELRERKPLILAYLAAAEPPPLPPLTRSPEGDSVPLTFAQQQIWLAEQLEPGTPGHNLGMSVHLTGPLDVDRLRLSLNEIVRRHVPLRTAFDNVCGEPRARVRPTTEEIQLETTDLSHVPLEEARQASRDVANERGLKPFDLAEDLLVRAHLVRLADDVHTLVLGMHHIASDGTSLVVFFEELTRHYARRSGDDADPPPELDVSYDDFARWQQEWMHGAAMRHLLDHWTTRCEGELPVLDLPADRPRPALPSSRGGSTTTVLPADAVDRLRALAAEENTTLFVAVLAGFQALLHRHSGASDVMVGIPVMGRDHPELRRLVGMFVNTLVLRADVGGHPTFRALVRQARRTTLDAFGHQALPFEKLVEALNPRRDPGVNPIFQVMLNVFLADTTPPEVSAGGVSFELMASPRQLAGAEVASKFDLTAYVTTGGGGALDLTLVYNADLFDDERMEVFADTFRTLLQSAASSPDSQIGDLVLLSEAAADRIESRREAVLPSGQFESFEPDPLDTICTRFADVVHRHGTRTAVRTGRGEHSYAELGAAAKAVASALRERGYAPGDRVGLLVDEAFARIACLLGILECGAAYVPLDSSYPRERLEFMVTDSGAGAVLTDEPNSALARCLGAADVLLHEDLSPSETDDARAVASSEEIAYVLYTSGSTGRPKGVIQDHRNVLRHIARYTRALHVRASDSLTLLSSFGFDATVVDTFGALLNGATLCTFDLRSEGSQGLTDRLIAEEITILHATPTVFRDFTTGPDQPRFPSVRAVVLGGEPVRRSDLDLFEARFPEDSRFVNLYGSAEHTLTCLGFFRRGAPFRGATVNGGRPVDGAEVALLGADGTVSNVSGEIAVRSGAIAVGYHDRPDEDAATFLTRDGVRWYRTGDLARRGPDGTLEYRGRVDRQVKIMGHRIEPGEVEAQLATHPAVRQSAVVAHDDRLVGYAVYEAGLEPTVSEIRGYLQERLPRYMVPGMIVPMVRLPLSANRKVDVAALPDPFAPRSQLAGGHVPPSTELERLIAEVWADLLGIERVSADANFFELGGHSLLAVRAAGQVEARAGRQTDARTMFFMTLRQIAASLATQGSAS